MAVRATIIGPSSGPGNVTTTTARVSFSCNASLPRDEYSSTGDSKNGTETTITYSDLDISWYFSPDGGTSKSKSGTRTFTSLAPGRTNTVSGSVSADCLKTTTVKTTKTTTEKVETGKDEEGNPIYEERETTETETNTSSSRYSLGFDSDSDIVYTKPNSWHWSGIGSNKIIQYTLQASEWNDLIEQCRKYKRWQSQTDRVSVNVDTVRSGQLITASLYNQMAQACGISTRVSGGLNGTVITASLFEQLANAVS